MHDSTTGNWIVFNGEVYNFAELRGELKKQGCNFHSDCDTEVILQSYRVWGRSCVTRWRGMFAVAIWDEIHQELFLTRDRLGVKPLYYYYNDGQFLFASELRALLATGLIDRKISLAALNTYLMFGAVQDPLTLVEGVLSLPAAHMLTVGVRGVELKEYWELPLDGAEETCNSAELRDRVAGRLEEAVRLRLVSDVPLGVFLSGGVDSSALAMLARRSSATNVKTFTIGFVNENFNETAQAQQTAEHLGVEHHSILLTEKDMLASCDHAVDALDQPSIDGFNTFHISRAVKEAGITVALSGLGGDEAFCGYKHFRTLSWMERFHKHSAHAPYALRRAGTSLLGQIHNSGSAKLRAFLLNDYGFTHPYFLTRSLFLPEQIASLFEREAILSIEYGPWAVRLREIVRRAQGLDPINRVSYFELKTYIANTLLRDADVMGMAHSVEIREPLLDHLLLEAVMRVPGPAKLSHNVPKPLLVRSLPALLPTGVTTGPKRGFTLPFAEWLPGRLRSEMENALAHLPKVLDGVINPENVNAIWRSFLSGGYSWTRPWSLYILYRVVDRLFNPANFISTRSHGEELAPDASEIPLSA
jgi:asparagine synthase (glutamine-hydrolysing)